MCAREALVAEVDVDRVQQVVRNKEDCAVAIRDAAGRQVIDVDRAERLPSVYGAEARDSGVTALAEMQRDELAIDGKERIHILELRRIPWPEPVLLIACLQRQSVAQPQRNQLVAIHEVHVAACRRHARIAGVLVPHGVRESRLRSLCTGKWLPAVKDVDREDRSSRDAENSIAGGNQLLSI